MRLRTLGKFCVTGLFISVLAACGGGSNSNSGPTDPETGNLISVFGSDGPMAGADVAVYGLQDYIDNNDSAENLLVAPATTDPVTALADNLELALDAGLGPFVVEISANETTIDLSTGAAPVFPSLLTIVTSLTDDRVYATPLTSVAALFSILSGENDADSAIAELASNQLAVKAFFGFGMDADIDIFTTPPVLDETTTTLELQQQVAQYRGANEAFATVIEGLGGIEAFNIFTLFSEELILEDSTFISAVQAFTEADMTARFADASITNVAQLLGADATTLADYAIDAGVNEAPSNVIDSDVDGVNNVDDAFDFDPAETADSDNDTVGDNADAFPNDPAETTDTDSDGTGDNADAFPNDSSETADSDNDTVGDNADAFPNDPSETADSDNDTVGDNADAFPNDPTETADSDNDTVGDNADAFPNDPSETADSDNDTVGDNADAFPNDPTEIADSDNDTVGDNADAFPNDPSETADSDNDTVGDNADAFPNDPSETTDSDNDTVGDNADAFPNDPSETADSDNDTVGDNADAFPNDPNETLDSDNDTVGDNADAFPNDPNETLDSDNDTVGDNADAFPNDPNETLDSDNDTVGDNADVFPNDPNETVDSDNDTVGDNADAFPNDPNETADTDNDTVGDNADNCPTVANADQADVDNNNVGDVCEATSVKYHFDFFYNQLSSDTGEFKAAVVGETVTQANGFIDIGTGVDSTTLDLGSTGTGTFDVRADYAITEESLSYTGTDFSSATATVTDETLSDDDLANTVTLLNGVLSFTDEAVTTDLTAWGANNYIGSGRVTLNGTSTTLATAEEQALSVLSIADGNSDDADLNADYGVVVLDIVYGNDGESATIDELVNLFSVVGVFGLDGAGNVALSDGSSFVSGLGIADGFVGFSTDLPATTGTYTVSPTGAVDLVIDGESNYGFTDIEGDLFTLGDPASRMYGVKLGTGNTNTDLSNLVWDLQGVVIESSNASLNASTYSGLSAFFNDTGTLLTLSGTVNKAVAAFSGTALPTVTTGTETFSIESNTVTVADNGHLSPITFADSGLELEGFVTANGGLLLRIVNMETVTSGSTPAGLQVGETLYPVADAPFNGDAPQVCNVIVTGGGECPISDFRDIAEGESLALVTDAGQILIGTWSEGGSGGAATTTPITADVRADSAPSLDPIAADTSVNITQGVLFGFPQPQN